MHAGEGKHGVWYVVHTKPKQEFRACEHLQNQGYECCLPTIQVEKSSRGKLESCSEPLFARYLFIRLDDSISNWSPVRSTRRVNRMGAFEGRFETLPNAWIEEVRNALLVIRFYAG